MQHSQSSLRLSFVDFSWCSMPPSNWYIDLLSLSTSHRCSGTCTGCGLQSPECIDFKLAVLVYRCLHGLAMDSLIIGAIIKESMVWHHGISPITSSASPISTAVISGRRFHCSWWSDAHRCPLSAIVHFQWLEAVFGTVCHPSLRQLQRSLFFGTASRLTFFQIISLITVVCI